MADLREYRVTVNGHDTVMNLSEEDAARLGGTPVEAEPKRADAQTKARTARNKSSE
ncbi:hypothetical protein AB5J62_33565 [Amycolatopsis sp. cg5]|uniref:hypothetical protein n=1 Tax=Amycolatopsis sp. cg5 TaxID=3238802 RepID=UPI003524C92D